MKWNELKNKAPPTDNVSVCANVLLHFLGCGCATDSMNRLHKHNNIRRLLRCSHDTKSYKVHIFLPLWQFGAAIVAWHLALSLHLLFTRCLRINFILLELRPKCVCARSTLRHSVPPLHAFIMFCTLIFYAKNNHVRWTFACENYVPIKCSIARLKRIRFAFRHRHASNFSPWKWLKSNAKDHKRFICFECFAIFLV